MTSDPTRKEPTTRDPNKAKQTRLKRLLANPKNHELSNRELARRLGVDESTVRKWKRVLGIPPLEQHSGRTPSEVAREAARKNRKKR